MCAYYRRSPAGIHCFLGVLGDFRLRHTPTACSPDLSAPAGSGSSGRSAAAGRAPLTWMSSSGIRRWILHCSASPSPQGTPSRPGRRSPGSLLRSD
jgi:hypothetical protein